MACHPEKRGFLEMHVMWLWPLRASWGTGWGRGHKLLRCISRNTEKRMRPRSSKGDMHAAGQEGKGDTCMLALRTCISRSVYVHVGLRASRAPHARGAPNECTHIVPPLSGLPIPLEPNDYA